MSGQAPYTLSPHPIGKYVHGINVNDEISDSTRQQLMNDLWKYKVGLELRCACASLLSPRLQFLVFPNQGNVSGDRHVEIAEWFGTIDNSSWPQHVRSPNK